MYALGQCDRGPNYLRIPSAGRGIWYRAASACRLVDAVESAETPKQEHEIVMLLNFFDELRRKVPVGK